jgi:hypothetical protein
MKFREALVGIVTALASAVASVFVMNRALEDKKTKAPASNTRPPDQAQSQSQTQARVQPSQPQAEARNPAGFFPVRQEQARANREQARKEAEQADAVQHERERKPIPPGWSRPEPKHIPRPTYWPVTMSVGITFIFWGVATSLIVSAIGLVVFIIALVGWIGEMRNDTHD